MKKIVTKTGDGVQTVTFDADSIPSLKLWDAGESQGGIIAGFSGGHFGELIEFQKDAMNPVVGHYTVLDTEGKLIIRDDAQKGNRSNLFGCITGAEYGKVTVVNGNVYVRPQPSMQYNPISVLTAGTVCDWLGMSANREWFCVKSGDITGYIYKTYASPEGTQGCQISYDIYSITEDEEEPYYGDRWSIREDTAKDIANAIREKTKETGEIQGRDFAEKIRSIQSGGGSDSAISGDFLLVFEQSESYTGEFEILEVS